MANLSTTSDIKTEILRSCGELTDGTSDHDARVLELLNTWHRAVLSGSTELNIECGDPWPWARSQYPGVLNLEPKYTNGTVALTAGSTSGTFSVAPAASLAGWYLKAEGRPEYFRIATHTAGHAAFTIDFAYSDETTAAIGFSAYKLDYTITNVLRLVAPFRVYRRQAEDDGKIDVIDKTAFDRDYPLHRITGGVPDRFAITYQTSDGAMTLRMNRIPSEKTRVEYDYIPYPSDLTTSPSTTPLVPKEHRQILVFGPAYSLCVEKNDDRAGEYKARAAALLEAMSQATRRIKGNSQRNFARLIPRPDLSSYRRYSTQEVGQ